MQMAPPDRFRRGFCLLGIPFSRQTGESVILAKARKSGRRKIMVRKVVTILLIGGGMALAACNTVRGAGEDLQSAANCTENAINNGQC
jgi:predicted small secreted protein